MTTWLISIWGEEHAVEALSRSEARFKSYRAYRDAGYRSSFPHFFGITKVRRAPATWDRSGEAAKTERLGLEGESPVPRKGQSPDQALSTKETE